jgi:hypothetical protein
MSKARRVAGGVLIATGIAVGLVTLRTAMGARTRAEAAVRADAEATAARNAEARRTAEARAREAGGIPALSAAMSAHVDGATLIDLFDNEDWWTSFRNEFSLVRIFVGDDLLATRGALPLGTRDAELVRQARQQGVASGVLTIDGGPVLVAASILGRGDHGDAVTAPVLLLARPLPSSPAAATLSAPKLADQGPYWTVAGGMALAGFGLLMSRGKARGSASITGEISDVVHETTAKMGSAPRPTATVGMPPPTHTPPAGSGWLTDGNAVRIPGNSTAPLVSAVAPPAPGRVAAAPAPIRASAAFRPPVTPFGRYRLRERIGEGGMSEIFLADVVGAEGFKRTLVVKRLRPSLARDEAAVAQFVDEARLQASLVHPNIASVLDFGAINGEYFMAAEYVAGRDLEALMARYQGSGGAPLPTPAAYYIAHETLQALAFAHESTDAGGAARGIVHRDVSLGNVLVSLTGEVKLIDFGIVLANDRIAKTQVGLVKGNISFMSPEQARGRVVDLRSDLYSLALVLYYMLTGEMLHSGARGSDVGMLYQAANGPTPADYARIRSLPVPAGVILEKALAFDPAERFQTAAEFADALAAHTSGGKTIASKLMQRLFGAEIRGLG